MVPLALLQADGVVVADDDAYVDGVDDGVDDGVPS